MLKLLPAPKVIQQRYEEGEFQFYPTGGGGELTTDFYGEAWITERWMEHNFRALGFSKYEFFPERGAIDQCIFVLTK
jgi:hypothetical protein